ncbi:MAG: hypothetical protein H7833_04340 [Magnetococcus sp. DMHC-1]|nr:hypothetical protein [Magnetococcales bacterium]
MTDPAPASAAPVPEVTNPVPASAAPVPEVTDPAPTLAASVPEVTNPVPASATPVQEVPAPVPAQEVSNPMPAQEEVASVPGGSDVATVFQPVVTENPASTANTAQNVASMPISTEQVFSGDMFQVMVLGGADTTTTVEHMDNPMPVDVLPLPPHMDAPLAAIDPHPVVL